MLGRFANILLRPFGVRLVPTLPAATAHQQAATRSFNRSDYPDFETFHADIIEKVFPYTMTSPERLYALISAVKYIAENKLPGDMVECGVWRGGSMMAIAETLLALGDTQRHLYMYDTYEGMSAPSEHDKDFGNTPAAELLQQTAVGTSYDNIWCYASLEDVQANLNSTHYPAAQLHFIKGPVEETLHKHVHLHPHIAMLRLDTDWYASTKVEIEQLYHLLVPGGFMIADDYGHWQGARQAIDEYFATLPTAPFLHRVDYTGRMMQKQPDFLKP
jgi:O-methyltransferase